MSVSNRRQASIKNILLIIRVWYVEQYLGNLSQFLTSEQRVTVLLGQSLQYSNELVCLQPHECHNITSTATADQCYFYESSGTPIWWSSLSKTLSSQSRVLLHQSYRYSCSSCPWQHSSLVNINTHRITTLVLGRLNYVNYPRIMH